MLPFLFDSLDFEKGEKIFETPFTQIHKCTNKITHQEFVAKEIIIYRENELAFKFLDSLNKLCSINHPNICPIYGYTLYDFERKPHQMILSPYYSNGSLEDFIVKHEFTFQQRAQICAGIADAISHLHQMKIFHGSIDSTNVLIDFDNSPKLIIPFAKSQNLVYTKDILDDYRDFAVLAFKLLSYKKDNQSICEIPAEIPQEIQNLIQKCFNIKNEIPQNENYEHYIDIDITKSFPFSSIVKEFKNVFSIPEDRFLVRKLIQKYDIEIGERNIENLFWQGLVYLNDTPRQNNLALSYIKASANRHFPLAMCRYAWMNLYGVGIEQNIEVAMDYYQKAANENVSEAQLQYGFLLLTQKKQVKESMNYYNLAYRHGSIEAAFKLGMLLEKMNHVEDAMKFYQIAADRNDSDAQCRLGEIYESQGKIEEAFELYKKSAEQLNPLGQYNLALLYENGFCNHRREPRLALKYGKLSANQEHPTGLWYYGYLVETGYGEDQDYEVAAKYYKMSANLNNSFGLWHYGSMLQIGRGVPQDLVEAARCFKLSADQGNEFGQCFYGVMLENGLGGVSRNLNEAENYYRLSAKQINRDGLFHYASLLERRNEIERASQYYRLAAKQNHPIALYRYGYYLENVKKEYDHALKYYHKASQLGNPDAMCSYALLADEDENSAKYLKASADLSNSEAQWRYGSYLLSKNDTKGAEKYFKLSADTGNPEGEWRYAYVLEKSGRMYEAEEYYKRSSIKNSAKGKSNIGFLAENGKIVSDYIANYRAAAALGSDVGQFNYALIQMNQQNGLSAAERYFKLSADQKNAPALYNLSKITEAKDPVKSAEYMKQAAQLGLAEAEVTYGLMLERGFGVKKNVDEAIKYYKLAAKKNDKNSQYNLALMLLNNADFKRAAILFKKSADQGHQLSALNLATMYEKGLGTEKSIENAVKYYQIAASSSSPPSFSTSFEPSSFLLAQERTTGVPEAQYNLALMYQNGNGFTQDFNEAYKLYKKASDAGLKQASYNLAVMLEQLYSNNDFNSSMNSSIILNNQNSFSRNDANEINDNNNSVNSQFVFNNTSPMKIGNFNNPININKQSDLSSISPIKNRNCGSTNDNYHNTAQNANINNNSNIRNTNATNFNGSNYKTDESFDDNAENNAAFGSNSIDEEIVELYKRAADKNMSDAQFRLYQIYSNGLYGCHKDNSIAIAYLKSAADYGNNAKALFRYAVLLQTGANPSVEKNEELAVVYYKSAINEGSLVAMVNLAAMIERGIGGLKKDEKLAAEMYKEAADLGCTVALFNYAVTLENGNGIEKDIELAKKYYMKAAKQGYKEAQERLQQLQNQ